MLVRILNGLLVGYCLLSPQSVHSTIGAVLPDGIRGDEQTSLGYKAHTGEVWIDASKNALLTSVNIESTEGVFTAKAAVHLGGPFDIDHDHTIFKATFGSSFGTTSFGQVAQRSLTETFMLGDLSVTGSLALGGPLGDVDLLYIPRGDYNEDTIVDVADVDLLCTEIARKSNTESFDLNDDALVNSDDLNAFLALANRLVGDSDFDGSVQLSDYWALAGNFGLAARGWSHGDFNCNGEVQFLDFLGLANNFGRSVELAEAVPEPTAFAVGWSALGILLCYWRWSRHHADELKEATSGVTRTRGRTARVRAEGAECLTSLKGAAKCRTIVPIVRIGWVNRSTFSHR